MGTVSADIAPSQALQAAPAPAEHNEPLLDVVAPACGPGEAHPAGDSSSTTFGLAVYATSSVLFATTGVFVKLLGQAGVPTMQIVFFRSLIVVALSLPQILGAGDNPFGNRRWLLLFRGVSGFLSVSALFCGIRLIPLADMAVLASLTPVFVAVGSPFLLRERPPRASFLCMAVCIFGVVLVTQPPFLFDSARLPLLSVAIGVLHPLLAALAKMSVRELCRTETSNVMLFYLSSVTVLGSFTAMHFLPGQYRPLSSRREVALVVASGVCGYATQACINAGLRRVAAAQAVTLWYLGVVCSGAAGVLMFGEYPDLLAATGDTVILLSTLAFATASVGAHSPTAPAAGDGSSRL